MNDRELPVGVFDSGVGGLTVLHECLVSLPAEDFLYLGDSGHFPYGTKTAEELARAGCNAKFMLCKFVLHSQVHDWHHDAKSRTEEYHDDRFVGVRCIWRER